MRARLDTRPSARASRRTRLAALPVVAALLSAGVSAPAADVPPAVDRDPHPRIFETRLEARPAEVDLDGDGSPESVYAFNGQVPGPRIRVRVGDVVVVHFKNSLPEPSSIHWHGVEVNNHSDGTEVTQNEVPPGGRFTYRFMVDRPGIFWYHPHIRPGNQVYKGLYGPFIVTDPNATRLARLGVLPARKKLLVLSDVTICREPGSNDEATFPADPELPWVGPGPFPGLAAAPTPADLCERPIDRFGHPLGEPLAAGAVSNVIPPRDCLEEGLPCRVNPGQTVLVNGRAPAARAGSPEAPGALAADAETLTAAAGEALRLRLINAAIFRYFRLRLTDGAGRQLPLYHVGGEGGLLNRTRLEGGTQGRWESGYGRGEILLAPSDRSEVVVVPDGAEGEVLTLWTLDYEHTGGGFAVTPSVPLLHIRIAGAVDPEERIRMGRHTALRVDPRVDRPLLDLRKEPPTAPLIDPATLGAGLPGTARSDIWLTAQGPSIDFVRGMFDSSAYDDYRDIPHLASSRYARVGDLLRLQVTNLTGAHHPFHLHGFSFQPVRLKNGSRTVRRFNHPEFADTMDIPPGRTLVFKVRLDDRPSFALEPGGGATGRWFFHCHILHHASLGMISELVVLPAED